MESKIQKIFIVGNAAGGKTRLSIRLSEIYKLPLTHVDSIQFTAELNIRPLDETRQILNQITTNDQWIIDGHGPLDLIEHRFTVADRIVFIDLPLYIHYWWFFKRQFKSIYSKRPELPVGSNELSLQHTLKLIKSIWKMHQQMRPQLHRILNKPELKHKVVLVSDVKTWNHVYTYG